MHAYLLFTCLCLFFFCIIYTGAEGQKHEDMIDMGVKFSPEAGIKVQTKSKAKYQKIKE